MLDSSRSHPVRRIREAFKNASEVSGLQQYYSSVAFAELIGRSPSSVRNVESGNTKKWDRLAKLIESRTGVSAEWMLGNPDPSEPILDIDGKTWEPECHLDYLGGAGDNINWRVLMMTSPRGAVKLATRIVEMKLSEDLLGDELDGRGKSTTFLSDLAQLLEKHECLRGEAVSKLVVETLVNDTHQIVADLVRATTMSKSAG